MGVIKVLKKQEIEASLEGLTRQYFAGNLKRPQKLPYFQSDDLEIGITSYDGFHSEPVHIHACAVEYQYMISGRTQYMDVETREVFEFTAGDFYRISPGTAYAQRAKPGTVILFIKVPSVNDKTPLTADQEVAAWLEEKLKTVRTDYYHDPKAPAPNSIRPAAAVAIVHEERMLMLKRSDNGKWTMPGGTLEFGESLTDCAVREVREVSGLEVRISDVIGTYTDPNIRIAYSDGEVRQEFTIVYAGSVSGGHVELDEESTDYRWIALDQVYELEMADSQKRRVKDVVEYFRTGQKRLG